ncbi:PLP-dependent cysteine synthase family protein [Candidatus Viridilinea mediisalina]|uniref:cysteine synthase n=1 Tax=Candidatus Viridilinea mediisalina TaxID=2024553 RepID=A0A2A6RIS3_9CHLR|nr:cysteine synthase family protein [Candidatus Viridilinea mediisalina]PDW02796.1 cysteine synthase [Candidatus Viridilinea mediisalina]
MTLPLNLIGNTPLLHLAQIGATLAPGVKLYAKAEWYNLGGSVKDRPALWMLRDGEQRGHLRPGMRVADATSGNTGIAYATIGAAMGYGVTLALPANASPERIRTLRALGAELILTSASEGMDLAIHTIRDLVASEPERYFYPDQYSNPANPQAHYETTAPEIWHQTNGQLSHFVAALGTSGTFMGTARRLREDNPQIQALAVQPDSPYHALEGVKHMASTSLVPTIYDPAAPDAILEVTSEAAFTMARRLARSEGLLVGISAAANVVAALRVAQTLTEGIVVTILCDSANRYLSERFWEESDYAAGAGI